MSPLRTARPPHAQRRSGAARGAFALLTALVCLAAQVAGVAHQGLVNHVRCLEHDALVHAGSAADHAPGVNEDVTAQGVPADLDGHEDDHCLAADLRRRHHWAAPLATVSAPPPASDDAGLILAPLAVPAPAVALLSLAPKSGPPAAAALRA